MQLGREDLSQRLANLAEQGVFLGTSSWKYPGWCGTLYDRERYTWRGKFAENRFNRNCIAEYAEVFKTVCVDAAYYAFPTPQYLQEFKALGVTAVPFFIIADRLAVSGAQPTETLLHAFEQAAVSKPRSQKKSAKAFDPSCRM